MDFQRTIRRDVSVEGVGLHSGAPVRLKLSPAGPDTGVIFQAPDGTLIPGNAHHVVDSRYATTVGSFGVRIRTIEHLMAAASAMGIDNLLVELTAEEVPALDGSAKPFVDLLYEAGRVTLPASRRAVVIKEPIRVGDATRWLQLMPSDDFRISYTLDNAHPVIGLQVVSVSVTEHLFVEELAGARTYGFLKDVPAMRRNGLARGGSLDNAVVVGKRAVLNESLRFPDEFVRHKILDLIGDLSLLGRPLVGHVVARNAGHALNHELIVAVQDALAAERRRVVARPVAHPVTRLPGVPLHPAPSIAAL